MSCPAACSASQRRDRVGGRAEEDELHARSSARLQAAVGGRSRGDRKRWLPSSRVRMSRSASRRTSGSRRSSISTPSRWSISCWNMRASRSSPSSTISLPSRSRPRIVTRFGAHDLEAEPGHRQAAFLVDPLARRLDDLGVDDHVGAVALVEVVGEEPLAHTDLRGGEADAVLGSIVSYMPWTSGDEVAVDRRRRRARAASARGRRRGGAGTCLQVTRRAPADRRPSVRPGEDRRRSGAVPGAGGVDPGHRERVAERGERGARSSARVEPDVPSATGPSTVTPAVGARALARGGDRLGARRSARPARRTAGSRAPAARRSRRRRPASGRRRLAACDHLVLGQAGLQRAGDPRPSTRRPRAAGRRGRAARAPARRPGPAARAAPGRARGTRPGRRDGGATGTRCSTASVPMSTSGRRAPRRWRRRPTPPSCAAAARRGRRARG